MFLVSRIISTRKKWMVPNLQTLNCFTCNIFYDNEHLDLLAISVGHCHQATTLAHCSFMYYSEPVAELTEKLLRTMPKRSDGED
jgi:hypothetical protein